MPKNIKLMNTKLQTKRTLIALANIKLKKRALKINALLRRRSIPIPMTIKIKSSQTLPLRQLLLI